MMKLKIHDRRSDDLPINARVAETIVDDPYGHGEKIQVIRSVRDDVLGHLHARKEIDEAQFQAGRRYERLAEQSQIGSVKAMDPTKEPVDGGGAVVEPISDRQIAAVRELSEAGQVLGRRNDALVRQILIDRLKFKAVAPSIERNDVAHARRVFFECLDDLAILWNFASERKK